MDVHLEISDILLGLYALAFIVVAFIQKAQIKNLQTTIDNFEKQFDELANITFLMLSELPEKYRKDLMNDTPPISKTLFEPLFQEIENNSNS